MSKSSFTTATKAIAMKTFRIKQTGIDPKTGKPRPAEVEVKGENAFVALGKHRGRGANGLGKGWQLTRQPDGWIVAVNRNQRTLAGGYYCLKEVDWTRKGDQSI